MRSLLGFLLSIISICCIGQEALGLKLDPYSGTEAIFLNPASAQLSAFTWDANLVSVHTFAYTDYGYIKQSKLLSLSSDLANTVVIDTRSGIPSRMVDVPIWIFDENGGDKSVSVHGSVSGPAFIFSVGNHWKAGLFSKARFNVSTFKIPEGFGLYELNTAFQTGQIDFRPGNLAGMVWNEIGIHASKRFRDFAIGFNLKVLSPLDGAYVNSNTIASVAFADNIITVGDNQIDSKFGITRNGNFDGNTTIWDSGQFGKGFSFDIGAQFLFEEISIGVALLDVGYARFDRNVENYSLPSNYETFDIDKSAYNSLRSVTDLLDQLGQDAPLVVNESGNDFVIGTPMGINVSASMPYKDNYHISATWTQRIKVFENSLARDNVISIVPRYQTKWISLFAPVSLYEYSRPRLGLAARFGYLTIGTDHVASVFTKANWRGSDVYMRLSLSPLIWFRKNGSKRKSKSSIDCYKFDKSF